MAASLNIKDILSQVKQLDKQEQFSLLEQLAFLLKKEEATKNGGLRLTALSGLGSEIWKDTDSIDDYLDNERLW